MSAVLLAALVLFVLLFDRLLGIAVPSLNAALLSAAGSAARYVTAEFEVTAHNNALGLRGTELSVAKSPSVKRVVALGDSFTWGWGVSDGEAWPAVLEGLLKGRGLRAEVANAGQPGADPVLYAQNARRIIPVLKPDLVIVGVLQGDDVEQLRESLSSRSKSAWVGKAIRVLLPNMLGLAKRLRTALNPVVEIGPSWRRQAQSVLRRMSEDEGGRYATLDAEVRATFEGGRLNPFFVQIALRRPDYFVAATRIEGLAVPQGIMADSLRDLAGVAAANGCEVIVVSIPYPVYVSRAELQTQRRIGFALTEQLLTSDVPDRTIQEACGRAGVPCVTVSSAFRDRCARPELFFPLDGHLNAPGHRFLAEQLAPIIERRLRGGR